DLALAGDLVEVHGSLAIDAQVDLVLGDQVLEVKPLTAKGLRASNAHRSDHVGWCTRGDAGGERSTGTGIGHVVEDELDVGLRLVEVVDDLGLDGQLRLVVAGPEAAIPLDLYRRPARCRRAARSRARGGIPTAAGGDQHRHDDDHPRICRNRSAHLDYLVLAFPIGCVELALGLVSRDGKRVVLRSFPPSWRQPRLPTRCSPATIGSGSPGCQLERTTTRST